MKQQLSDRLRAIGIADAVEAARAIDQMNAATDAIIAWADRQHLEYAAAGEYWPEPKAIADLRAAKEAAQ